MGEELFTSIFLDRQGAFGLESSQPQSIVRDLSIAYPDRSYRSSQTFLMPPP